MHRTDKSGVGGDEGAPRLDEEGMLALALCATQGWAGEERHVRLDVEVSVDGTGQVVAPDFAEQRVGWADKPCNEDQGGE